MEKYSVSLKDIGQGLDNGFVPKGNELLEL